MTEQLIHTHTYIYIYGVYFIYIHGIYYIPGGLAVKCWKWGLIPRLGRSPGEGNSNPFQYSLSGESHGQRSLAGYSLKGHKEQAISSINGRFMGN